MHNHLERLIKQTVPFSSPQIKAQLSIFYLAYQINYTKQQQFKQYNITLQQYNILRILRGQYPKSANISLLRDRMLDKMSDVSRLINRLESLKLVSKHPNDLDKRNTDVLITDKALILLETIEEIELEKDTVFHKISSSDIDTLNEILDNLLSDFK